MQLGFPQEGRAHGDIASSDSGASLQALCPHGSAPHLHWRLVAWGEERSGHYGGQMEGLTIPPAFAGIFLSIQETLGYHLKC